MKYVSQTNAGYYDYGNNVLNGIAYDSANDEFYITGKRWNFMFKLKIFSWNESFLLFKWI